MRFFYNKKTGEYVGGSDYANGCPDGCNVTESQPENSGQVFDVGGDCWVDQDAKPAPKKTQRRARKFDAVAYQAKAAAYTDRQLQAAMMRAKGEKLAILEAEQARRA